MHLEKFWLDQIQDGPLSAIIYFHMPNILQTVLDASPLLSLSSNSRFPHHGGDFHGLVLEHYGDIPRILFRSLRQIKIETSSSVMLPLDCQCWANGRANCTCSIHIAPLVAKWCNFHFEKWQLHPFSTNGRYYIYLYIHVLVLFPRKPVVEFVL